MIVTLPIFHTTDESEMLRKVGIDYSLEEKTAKRLVTFFNINAISPYFDDDKQYCSIHSNGTEYICALDYAQVENLIKKSNGIS